MSLSVEEQKGRLLYIYCDESRQTADRYMVIGGLIIRRDDELRFIEAMTLCRQRQNMWAELKWTKVSNQKITEYQAFIEAFFSLNHLAHFKAIVVDTREIDNRQYNRNDAELGFYKLMYQFILHSFGTYLRPADRGIIFLHRRTTSHYKLSTLCAILNNGLHKKYPYLNKPIRSIQAVISAEYDSIQIADILMGAIGYEMNGYHQRIGAKEAKVLLAQYIAQKAGLSSLQEPTPRGAQEFSIWHFHFRNYLRKNENASNPTPL